MMANIGTGTRQSSCPIGLVALDLDGTIVDGTMGISPRVQTAVRTAIEHGVHVILATGRIFGGARVFAERLGIRDPLICVQGALVQDVASGARLLERSVPLVLAWEVIGLAQRHGWDLCVYLDDTPHVDRITPRLAAYASYAPEREELCPVGDLRAWLAKAPLKLLVAADEDECDRAESILRQRFAGQLKVVRSFPTYVEATSLNATKGQALAFVSGRLGIQQAATMAIGDHDNDADMIVWAGLGIAMGNASPTLKAVADAVCPSLEEDGAAVAIEQWVLTGASRG